MPVIVNELDVTTQAPPRPADAAAPPPAPRPAPSSSPIDVVDILRVHAERHARLRAH
ncbi:MAG TPA: hypothetical protein VES39_11960 [Rhodospirillales bacterium]|nr:hypothetical protein [Rhodospirillales bacterium]